MSKWTVFTKSLPTMERLERNVRAARTRHAREQHRGLTDMSVQQTRRMALAVGNLQRHEGALAREVRSQHIMQSVTNERPTLTLIQGGRA